eukprot:3267320-Pyramimonas_sp.AAC.1
MGDLHGHLGDNEAPGTGGQGYPEPTTANGERIIAFAAATGMEAVSTTRDSGASSRAHAGSQGQEHRIDSMMVGQDLAQSAPESSTEPGLDRG